MCAAGACISRVSRACPGLFWAKSALPWSRVSPQGPAADRILVIWVLMKDDSRRQLEPSRPIARIRLQLDGLWCEPEGHLRHMVVRPSSTPSCRLWSGVVSLEQLESGSSGQRDDGRWLRAIGLCEASWTQATWSILGSGISGKEPPCAVAVRASTATRPQSGQEPLAGATERSH